jgi:hypothetical protein
MKFLDLGLIFNDFFCEAYKKKHNQEAPVLEIEPLNTSIIITLIMSSLEIFFYVYMEWETATLVWLIMYNSLGLVIAFGLRVITSNAEPNDIKLLENILVNKEVMIRFLFDHKSIYETINNLMFGGLVLYIISNGDQVVGIILLFIWYFLGSLRIRNADTLKVKFYHTYMRRLEDK